MLCAGSVPGGKYKILSELGQGGMGHVWLAQRRADRKCVVIKEAREGQGPDHEISVRSLENERALLEGIRHRGIPAYLDWLTCDGGPLLVREYREGYPLSEAVRRNGPMEVSLVLFLMRQMCGLLLFLHRRNIILCDLKPANLVMNTEGILSLIDLGSAYVKPDSEDLPVSRTNRNLSFHAVTPKYAAPELSSGEPDERSDIYSLGVTALFLLTGKTAGSKIRAATSPGEEERTFLRKLHKRAGDPDNLQRKLTAVILKCMEKNPAERFQSAGELKRSLDALSPVRRDAVRLKRAAVCAALCMISAVSLGAAATFLAPREYAELFHLAEETAEPEERKQLLFRACALPGRRPDERMCTALMTSCGADGMLDAEEQAVLEKELSLYEETASGENLMQADKNRETYAALCLRMGKLFRDCSTDTGSSAMAARAVRAEPWFRKAFAFGGSSRTAVEAEACMQAMDFCTEDQ